MALAGAVGLAAWTVAELETARFGHPVVEALVVAIILGMVVRTAWTPPARAEPGVRLAGKGLLELAVCLMGLSVDLPMLVSAGPALAIGVVLLVVIGLALSYSLGRAFGLPHKLAVLVACGNAICGNSAIAAVAPVIGADAEQVGSAIAFTAILGVAVVLGLPLLITPLGLSFYQYGVLAGLTVYAVPQVLAAAFPVSVLSGQVGTLVKLVRVLMLGPVVLFFALRQPRVTVAANDSARQPNGTSAPLNWSSIGQFVPWFIVGFLALAGVRAMGWAPDATVRFAHQAATILTVVAMAALGLGCDLRAIARAGAGIVATVVGSLLVLVTLSVLLIHILGIS
ncbi:MAG: putative sulfate exporter family transporter [Gemmatimonas sp.]